MLYIIPPLRKGRLGGDCDTPNSLHPPLPPPFQEGAKFLVGADLPLQKLTTVRADLQSDRIEYMHL